MAPKSRRKVPARRPPSRTSRPAARPRPASKASARATAKPTPKKKFVGRESSPVLERYPSKSGAPVVAGAGAAASPAVPSTPGVLPPPTPLPPLMPLAPGTAPTPGLISLDRPFDVDEFSQSLGENQVHVLVPREDLAEVLRRVMDFMGFGIYVYSIRVTPENAEILRRFVVDLQRVDYSTQRKVWVAFEDKGRADSPFGPGGGPPP